MIQARAHTSLDHLLAQRINADLSCVRRKGSWLGLPTLTSHPTRSFYPGLQPLSQLPEWALLPEALQAALQESWVQQRRQRGAGGASGGPGSHPLHNAQQSGAAAAAAAAGVAAGVGQEGEDCRLLLLEPLIPDLLAFFGS